MPSMAIITLPKRNQTKKIFASLSEVCRGGRGSSLEWDPYCKCVWRCVSKKLLSCCKVFLTMLIDSKQKII